MNQENISITPTEWNLMECLWEASPRTGREATAYLAKHVGWTRSTTLTMLRRMTEKGIIQCDVIEGVNAYSPLIRREDVVIKETEDFLDRVHKGSISLMVSALTKKQGLSQEEMDALYLILKQAKEGEQG